MKNKIVELYDGEGNLLGAFIDKELWLEVKHKILIPEVEKRKKRFQDISEPLEDWEMFKKCWDFKYPYDFSVKCSLCGNETENWEQDSEKKFFLTAASVSGLVSFRCANCNAKIVKKHFKDKITTECIPYKGQ